MKILLIGYGSIGQRHYEILLSLDKVSKVDVVSKQVLPDINSFEKIEDVNKLDDYDYFVICSETVKHYEQLKYICSKVNDKIILVEKPIFDREHTDIITNNKILVSYNLRFHPILEKLRNLIKNEETYYVNVVCSQYLPSWRPGQDYRKSYSADKNRGGGVLRDLSHELDYICWLFGDINKIDSINTKISDLEINSDDIFTAIATTNNKSIINLTIDYISKVPMRKLIIHTKDNTIEANIIKANIMIYNKNGNKEIIEMKDIDRNYTYTKLHQSILNNDFEIVCSFEEGKKVVNIIENIEFKEL